MLMFAKRMKENVKKNRKGYTLTELIVVVAILGVLAAVGAPMILSQINNAREKADDTNAKNISNAYKIYVADNGAATDKSGAVTAITKALNPIPTCQRSGYIFAINVETGECQSTTTAITALPSHWYNVP